MNHKKYILTECQDDGLSEDQKLRRSVSITKKKTKTNVNDNNRHQLLNTMIKFNYPPRF